MLKYFPEGSFDNAYTAVEEFLTEYLYRHDNYFSDLIVDIETKNCGRSNEYCQCTEMGGFCFDNDWYEGGWIKVYGYIHLDDVKVPEMEDAPNKDKKLILCKDCKHRPIEVDKYVMGPRYDDGNRDITCPFLCEDPYYSRIPSDYFYCANGEKK